MQNTGIILEGADQSGKSTLAEKISKLTGHNVIHYDPPQDVTDFYTEYTKFLLPGNKAIVDRNYMSEMVYGKMIRNGSGVTELIKKQIETSLYNQNYVLVLCHRKDFGEWNFDTRKELFNRSQIMEVRSEYLLQFNNIALPKITIDPFENDCIWDIIELCIIAWNGKQMHDLSNMLGSSEL